MSRTKKIVKKNQLAFNFDGTGALEIKTVVEHEFDSWIKNNNIRLLSEQQEELKDMLRDRYCYQEELEDFTKVIPLDESESEDDNEENKGNEEGKAAAYKKLKALQALPLEFKIQYSLRILDEAASKYGISNLLLAYSGGKDSEVLSHLVTEVWGKRVLHVFSNTTCEFPETLQRVKERAEEGVDIVMVSPKMSFNQVVKKYGYPMISKNISKSIRIYRNARTPQTAWKIKDYFERREKKWLKALDMPFSESCCDKLKKEPMRRFQKAFGYECSIVGTLAAESKQRTKEWVDSGCNAFNGKNPKCMPLSIWTDKDVYEYMSKHVKKVNKLYSMGYNRNGCMFCGYGCHLQKNGENRIKLMKETHPHAYGVFVRNFAKYFDMMQEAGYDEEGFTY